MSDAWLTPAQVAARLQVSRDFVYRSSELREVATRLGSGPHAPLRWRPEDVDRAFTCQATRDPGAGEPSVEAASRPTRKRRSAKQAAGVADLLPFDGWNGES